MHIRYFQPVGVHIERHLYDVRELKQVLPMHDRIDRQRQIQLARPPRDLNFLLMRAFETSDAVGQYRLVALKADLHVAESGIGER